MTHATLHLSLPFPPYPDCRGRWHYILSRSLRSFVRRKGTVSCSVETVQDTQCEGRWMPWIIFVEMRRWSSVLGYGRRQATSPATRQSSGEWNGLVLLAGSTQWSLGQSVMLLQGHLHCFCYCCCCSCLAPWRSRLCGCHGVARLSSSCTTKYTQSEASKKNNISEMARR